MYTRERSISDYQSQIDHLISLKSKGAIELYCEEFGFEDNIKIHIDEMILHWQTKLSEIVLLEPNADCEEYNY